MKVLRPEHPNPQWERENWINLNGEWEFDFDHGKSAREKFSKGKLTLTQKINVPFCPESRLSGIGYEDFLSSVCYRKVLTLTKENLEGNIFLHFGAVDYHAFVYINGQKADEHRGGFSSFKVDITPFAKEGENEIFVIAEDNQRDKTQPIGKQRGRYFEWGLAYMRTTGIWQTVWLEFTPKAYIKSCKYFPDIENKKLFVEGEVCGEGTLSLSATYEGKNVGHAEKKVKHGFFTAEIALSELYLWEVGNGRLYDLEFKFGEDTVKSYFGMREVCLKGKKFLLNGKTLFLRTVLDQGYNRQGVYTAPDTSLYTEDIKRAQALGFNSARPHQKVFEKRYIYECDKAGFLIWGEHANWGIDNTNAVAQGNFICEWSEIIERDFNSPALIGWCPFNETWGYIETKTPYRFIESVYKMTKLFDKTRPCIDASGNFHLAKKEIHDVHDYEHDPELFKSFFCDIDKGIIRDQVARKHGDAQPYNGEPVYVSEYGGITWAPGDDNCWAYGKRPETPEEYADTYCALCDILISNPEIMGLCYTQLYDIETEKNGIYYYDRTPKFDEKIMARLKAAMEKKAAIEE